MQSGTVLYCATGSSLSVGEREDKQISCRRKLSHSGMAARCKTLQICGAKPLPTQEWRFIASMQNIQSRASITLSTVFLTPIVAARNSPAEDEPACRGTLLASLLVVVIGANAEKDLASQTISSRSKQGRCQVLRHVVCFYMGAAPSQLPEEYRHED